jgi:predicted TIM-barrel fold metal-dependent hydrolase
MKQSPAEMVRDHIRVTMQPFDSAGDAETVQRLMEQIDSDRMLLFSSDYPHWQFDGDAILPPGLTAEQVRRIKVDNPLETYPRLQETAP